MKKAVVLFVSIALGTLACEDTVVEVGKESHASGGSAPVVQPPVAGNSGTAGSGGTGGGAGLAGSAGMAGTSDAGGAAGGSSGIPSSKKLRDYNASEMRAFCDWAAAIAGGYGAVRECEGGVRWRADASQEACLKDKFGNKTSASCTGTTADAETCLRFFETDAACSAQITFPDECGPVLACGST